VTESLKDELSRLDPTAAVDGYLISFDYAIFGQGLISSLYPSNTILLRKNKFLVRDKGHKEAWTVYGPVKDLKGCIIHDDRKPSNQWIRGTFYALQRLSAESALSLVVLEERLRGLSNRPQKGA